MENGNLQGTKSNILRSKTIHQHLLMKLNDGFVVRDAFKLPHIIVDQSRIKAINTYPPEVQTAGNNPRELVQ